MDIEKIKQWRPHDWKGHELKWKQTAEECYEEGADALLGALIKEGWRVNGDSVIPAQGDHPEIHLGEKMKGYLIFIPDEEKLE